MGTALLKVARLRETLATVARVMNMVAGWLIVACAFLIVADIFGREVIGSSLGASVQLSSYCLAICISWGLAHAMSERQHVRVDLVVARCPGWIRKYLHLLALAAMLAWCAFLAYAAVALVIESNDFGATDRSTLNLPLVLPQGIWAFGIIAFVVFLTVLFVETALAIASSDGAHVDRLLGSRTMDDEAREALEAVPHQRSDSA